MDPLIAPYASATSLKPSKAFAAAFAALALTLAGCATGLGATSSEHSKVAQVSRVEEGVVVGSRGVVIDGSRYGALEQAGYAYTVKLRSGELVSITQAGDLAIAKGAPVLVEYDGRARMIPQNATIGY